MIHFIGGMILFIVGILAGYLFCCLDFLSRYDELKQENKFLKEELKKKYVNTR
jgi:Tfp pilus assembly protein PilO